MTKISIKTDNYENGVEIMQQMIKICKIEITKEWP